MIRQISLSPLSSDGEGRKKISKLISLEPGCVDKDQIDADTCAIF